MMAFTLALGEVAAEIRNEEFREELRGDVLDDDGNTRDVSAEADELRDKIEALKEELAASQIELSELGIREEVPDFIVRVGRAFANVKAQLQGDAGNASHPMTKLRRQMEMERKEYAEASRALADSAVMVEEFRELYVIWTDQYDSFEGKSSKQAKSMLAEMMRNDGALGGDASAAQIISSLEDPRLGYINMTSFLEPFKARASMAEEQLREASVEHERLKRRVNEREKNALGTAKRLHDLEGRDPNAWARMWEDSFEISERPTANPFTVFQAQLFQTYAVAGVGEALSDTEYKRLMEIVLPMRISAITYGEEVVMNLESFESPERKTLNAICAAMAIVKSNAEAGIVASASAIGISEPVPPKLGGGRLARRYKLDGAYGFTAQDYDLMIAANLSTTMNSLVMNELGNDLHEDGADLILANKVSRCGLDPRKWFKECKVATSGVVDRTLQMWAENGYHALTAEELRAAYDPGYRYVTASVDYHSLYHLDDGSRPTRGGEGDDDPDHDEMES